MKRVKDALLITAGVFAAVGIVLVWAVALAVLLKHADTEREFRIGTGLGVPLVLLVFWLSYEMLGDGDQLTENDKEVRHVPSE